MGQRLRINKCQVFASNAFHLLRIDRFPRTHIASAATSPAVWRIAAFRSWRLSRRHPVAARRAHGRRVAPLRAPASSAVRLRTGRPAARRTSSTAPPASMASKRASMRGADHIAVGQHQQAHGLVLAEDRRAGLALPGRQRPAGAFQHLQRAYDALRIGRHQARRHLRIALSQQRMQLRRRPLGSLRRASRRAPPGRLPGPARAPPAAP